MFGSGILEVAISLVFVYFLLSLTCTVFNEWVARMLSLRSKTLEAGIRNLLSDPEGTGHASAFYNHPLIKGLAKQGGLDRLLKKPGRPSYVSAQTFALALLDVIAPAKPGEEPKTFKEVRDTVDALPESLRKALLPLIDQADKELKKARENIENWFDEAMKRVTGWYTRKAAVITVLFALVVTIALNADTIMMARSFSQDAALRAVVVEAADEAVNKSEKPPDVTLKDIQGEIERLQLPLGWSINEAGSLDEFDEIASKIIGLLITTLAVSLGAPFWFDVLNKLVNMRKTGKPPEEASEEQKAEGERPLTIYLSEGGREE